MTAPIWLPQLERALAAGDARALASIPKTDLHCHGLLSAPPAVYEQVLGHALLPPPRRFADFDASAATSSSICCRAARAPRRARARARRVRAPDRRRRRLRRDELRPAAAARPSACRPRSSPPCSARRWRASPIASPSRPRSASTAPCRRPTSSRRWRTLARHRRVSAASTSTATSASATRATFAAALRARGGTG